MLAALLTSGVQAVLLNERGAEQKMVQMDARTFTLTPTFQPPTSSQHINPKFTDKSPK